jgi:Domain of unknown function (DUF1906)
MALGKLLDWSQARPPLAQVKAHGYSAAFRYVCSDAAEAGLPGKRLTPVERDQILHAGLDIGLHGEDEAGAARNGYARGLAQGRQWADYAHRILKAPAGMTIFAAIDYDTVGTYPQVVRDYLGGVTDGFAGEYATGVYGSIYVVDGALAEHAASHAVQTIAWSHSQISTRAHVYQHGGSEFPGTDYNDILRVPYGSWLQTLRGEDMPLTSADVNLIWDEPIVNTLVENGLSEPARTRLLKAQAYANEAQATAHEALAKITALQAAVAQLGVSGGVIDYGLVEQAAENALAKVHLTVTSSP